ncbi:MAG: hypothetical protein IJU66_07810, partial [Oscillospiraceae bacterium]|nr:hypothetical protein [Oscillospiraceae bacterium]
ARSLPDRDSMHHKAARKEAGAETERSRDCISDVYAAAFDVKDKQVSINVYKNLKKVEIC